MAHNVTHEFKGDKLLITVDLSKKLIDTAPSSSTGKTNLVASTSGYMKIGDKDNNTLSLAVTVTAKPKK